MGGCKVNDVAAAAGGDAAAQPRLDWPLAWKGAVDLVFGWLLLVGTLPLVGLAMALVKLSSRGPVIYTQTRVGRHGRRFTIYKIRTMHHDCERLTGPVWSTENDPRVFPVGR